MIRYRYECIECNAIHTVSSYENLRCLCGSKKFRLLSYTEGTNPPSKLGYEREYKDLKEEFVKLVYGRNPNPNEATENLVKYILSNYNIYTTKDDNKPEVWIYLDGIYIPQGRSEIKGVIRNILEEFFNAFYFNQIMNKIEADTFIDQQKFFSTNYVDEVPVENGILNIFTRELTKFTPKKIFFSKLPIIYNKDATCPSIDLFLNDVLAKEDDKKVFYEFAGTCLLKEYRYEKALMMVGDGRNGKGKTLEFLKRAFGPSNCYSLPLSAISTDNADVSGLFGKLINLAGDIGSTDLKDTSLFKSLTGRDLITTKRKFLTALTFENYAKFIFACNKLPIVYDTERGFWDRWILLEFPYTFVTREEYDSALDKSKLKIKDDDIVNNIVTSDELSGFLNAILDGLDRLMKNKNFSKTLGSEQIKQLWMRKSNSFLAFALDYLEADYEAFITKKEMRRRYHAFTKEHKILNKTDYVIKKVLQEEFGVTDERKLINQYPNNDWDWVWSGIKWKN